MKVGVGTGKGVIGGESWRNVTMCLSKPSVSHRGFPIPSAQNALPAERTRAQAFSSFKTLPKLPLTRESFSDHPT